MNSEDIDRLATLNNTINEFFATLTRILTPMEVNYMAVRDPQLVHDAMLQLRPLVSTFTTTDALPRLQRVSDLWDQLYELYFPSNFPRQLTDRRMPPQLVAQAIRLLDLPHVRTVAVYDSAATLRRGIPTIPPPPGLGLPRPSRTAPLLSTDGIEQSIDLNRAG